eukprot:m.562057 g.562057  ORF g.562057 m.562057 type:complete len:53 (-) comp22219_c0_seq7:372-530(-)
MDNFSLSVLRVHTWSTRFQTFCSENVNHHVIHKDLLQQQCDDFIISFVVHEC